MNKINISGEITKSVKKDDGTLMVCGYASAEVVDSDGEIITAEAMRKAVENYMKFPAVREMHGNSAAGITVHAEVQDDGRTYVEVLVVDGEAVKKCEYKVYKAFSIGGRVKKRNAVNKSIIEEVDWVELSLVDRPANPEAVFTAFKADGIDEEVPELATGGLVPELDTPMLVGEKTGETIVRAPTEADDKTASAEVEPTEPQAEEIKKSLSDVGWLANILCELKYLHNSLTYEAEWRENDSIIPAELKEVVISISNVLNNLVVQETAQAVENLTNSEKSIILGNNNDDVLKAGQRNSKKDAELIQQIYDIALQLGATSPSNVSAIKSETTEDLNKAETLQKSLNEALEKAQKLESDKEDLSKRVKELEALPKPRKGVLSMFGKSEDIVSTTDELKVEPILKTDGTVDEVATAIKKSLMARTESKTTINNN